MPVMYATCKSIRRKLGIVLKYFGKPALNLEQSLAQQHATVVLFRLVAPHAHNPTAAPLVVNTLLSTHHHTSIEIIPAIVKIEAAETLTADGFMTL